ncbi:MAG: hypothetical protein AAGI22_29255 [Planctomycetota bacterium]
MMLSPLPAAALLLASSWPLVAGFAPPPAAPGSTAQGESQDQVIDGATYDRTRPAPPPFEPPPDVAPDVEGGEFTRFFHDDGTVAREGFLLDGARAGVWKAWAPDGKLDTHGAYRNYRRVGPWIVRGKAETRKLSKGMYDAEGLREGTWASYDDDGALRLLIDYVNGERHGKFRRYNAEGLLITLEHFRAGRKDGPSLDYIGDLLHEEGSYADGKRTGSWKSYHPNGALETQGSFVNGLQVGEWVEYHDNGQRKSIGGFENGVATGEWRGFHRQGERRYVSTYRNGQPNGPYVEWYPSGDKKSEGAYLNGQYDGPWTFWQRDGRVDATTTGTYRKGDLVR